jgi:predicted MFS family arabinose efflux permease
MRSWSGVFAAFASTLLGLGLARFAYTPLIPALVDAHWFTPGEAAYLGAANIGGYLAGALLGVALARLLGVRRTLRLFMVITSASLFGCSLNWGFRWYLLCRLGAGFAAAVMMVTAAPSVLPGVEDRHRGLAGGLIFLGIGIGIAASGTLTPLLLPAGLPAVWVALGAAGSLLTLLAWGAWPPDPPPRAVAAARAAVGKPLLLLCSAYAISAFAQVPAILFLADFIARGLRHGTAAGAAMWAILGLGAAVGPVMAGAAADRIGEARALRILWLLQIAAFLLLAWPAPRIGQAAASALLGAGIPALVVLVLGWSRRLVPGTADDQRQAWSLATAFYAAGQAAGAYGLAYLFARSGDYRMLFLIGAGTMAGALLTGEVCSAGTDTRPRAPAH